MNCSTPGFPVLHHLPELAQTHVHWVDDAIQPSHPLSSPSPPAPSPSKHQGLFQWVSSSHEVAKVLEFQHQFSISPSNEYSRLVPFRIDWFDLLAVQGTLKSLFQQHSLKASILWHSAFFMVQLSYQYIQFSHSVVSNSLQPHGLQHTRPPCPSPTPRVYSNSCPLSRWCHPTISSSVIPFFSCLQSFPASGPFQMSQLFASGGQSIGVLASTPVLPMNTQDWSPLGWTSWIFLQSKGLSRVFSNTTVQKHQFFGA